MMCSVTIPGSELDQKSKNAIKKKSSQLHIVCLKSGSSVLPRRPLPAAQEILFLCDTKYLYENVKKLV